MLRWRNTICKKDKFMNYQFDTLFTRLKNSPFRARFKLSDKDKLYIQQKGIDTIRAHCQDFVQKRLAPAIIPNDGKQTPMRGHPVFVAQHATACCCRGCISKWHKIPAGHTLTQDEQNYIISVIMEWIEREITY